MRKFNVFNFLLQNHDEKKMPYIQFCKARRALPSDI